MAAKKRATSKKGAKKAALKPIADASKSVALTGAVAIGVAGSLASPQKQAMGVSAIALAGGSKPTAGTAPQFSELVSPPQTSIAAFDRGAFTGAFETPPPLPLNSAVSAIERMIAQRPSVVRERARYFAKEFSLELDKLRRTKPNEPKRLAEYERVVGLFNRASNGFRALADTLDEGAPNNAGASFEPVVLGRAAEIVHSLGEATKEWFAENSSIVFEGAVRIGLLGLGILFLSSLGIDPTFTTTAAVAYIAKTAGKSKSHGSSPKKKPKKR